MMSLRRALRAMAQVVMTPVEGSQNDDVSRHGESTQHQRHSSSLSSVTHRHFEFLRREYSGGNEREKETLFARRVALISSGVSNRHNRVS